MSVTSIVSANGVACFVKKCMHIEIESEMPCYRQINKCSLIHPSILPTIDAFRPEKVETQKEKNNYISSIQTTFCQHVQLDQKK